MEPTTDTKSGVSGLIFGWLDVFLFPLPTSVACLFGIHLDKGTCTVCSKSQKTNGKKDLAREWLNRRAHFSSYNMFFLHNLDRDPRVTNTDPKAARSTCSA